MRIHFLGTSSGVPTANRNVSGIGLVLDSIGQTILFDCGEGTQHQINKSEVVKSSKIYYICITHLHGDHVFGLPGLLCSLSMGARNEDRTVVHVFGPIGLLKFLRVNLSMSDAHLGFMVCVHEIVPPEMTVEQVTQYKQQLDSAFSPLDYETKENSTPFIYYNSTSQSYSIFKIPQHTIVAAPILHGVFCVGYVVEEDPLPGRLMVEKLKPFGLKGQEFGQIKSGKDITLANGTVLYAKEFIEPERPGRKVAILGDTCDPFGMTSIAMNCDAITHESTLEDEKQQMAVERGHSTPCMAAKFADAIQAQTLILTHFSARYTNPEEKEETVSTGEDGKAPSLLLLLQQGKDARKIGLVELAQDFKTFEIKKTPNK